MVLEPDTDACCPVQFQVFPGPPQGFYPADRFRVEVPRDAPFSSAAVDVADIGRKQLLVKKFLGRAVNQLRCLLILRASICGRFSVKRAEDADLVSPFSPSR